MAYVNTHEMLNQWKACCALGSCSRELCSIQPSTGIPIWQPSLLAELKECLTTSKSEVAQRKKQTKKPHKTQNIFLNFNGGISSYWKVLLEPRHSKSGSWCCAYCSCDSEQKQKRKEEKAPVVCTLLCRAHLKENTIYSISAFLSRLQRLVQKLERTGIDLTSDGSGIDNWTLRNALLSWTALKISTVRPTEGGVVPSKPLLNVWNAHSWLGSQAFWQHAIPHFSHRESFTLAWIGSIWLVIEFFHSRLSAIAWIIQLKISEYSHIIGRRTEEGITRPQPRVKPECMIKAITPSLCLWLDDSIFGCIRGEEHWQECERTWLHAKFTSI